MHRCKGRDRRGGPLGTEKKAGKRRTGGPREKISGPIAPIVKRERAPDVRRRGVFLRTALERASINWSF